MVPNFCCWVTIKSYFFIEILYWAPYISQHQLIGHPLTFIRPRPRIFSCINFPCYLILKPYLSKRHLHLRDFHKGYKNPIISKSLWGIPFTSYTQTPPSKGCQTPFNFRDSIYKLYVNEVYILATDAKLLFRDSVDKLNINMYLLLRDSINLQVTQIYNNYFSLKWRWLVVDIYQHREAGKVNIHY